MRDILIHHLIWLLVFSVVVSLFCVCTPVVPRRVGGEPLDRRAVGEKDFDPLGFEEDTLIVSRGELNREGVRAPGEIEERPGNKTPSQQTGGRTVYRVQIFMTKYPELASEKALEAEVVFSERVHIDFEAPYYRVRVGDFETLEAGEEFLFEVRDSGYGDAWLVKTRLTEGN
jgi:hypothetical protein